MKVQFTQKQVWGKPLYYPENELAKGLCSLFGQKTLTIEQLFKLRNLGFEMDQVFIPIEL